MNNHRERITCFRAANSSLLLYLKPVILNFVSFAVFGGFQLNHILPLELNHGVIDSSRNMVQDKISIALFALDWVSEKKRSLALFN